MNILKINNFKCFTNIEIPLNKLTIMAGVNGNGKSTAIQSLLFLKSTINRCVYYDFSSKSYMLSGWNEARIPLNEDYCLSLGTVDFILNKSVPKSEIYIGLNYDDVDIDVKYIENVDSVEPQLWILANQIKFTDNFLHKDLPILKQQFYYLNAERTGPRIAQDLRHYDYQHTGWKGENTAQIIDLEEGFYKVNSERLCPHASVENRFTKEMEVVKSANISDQINAWLGYIIPGVSVKASKSKEALTSQVLIENQFTTANPTIATNIGFGISYVLPIIATGLIAEKGSYLIVENPEAHLHPSAQSRVGRFLAMVASSGVNVIIETHSDHLINGIQIAVAEKKIANSDVTINFFSHQENSIQPEVKPIKLKDNGELTHWPKGFFDQTQLDYSHLMQLRKNV
jgi:predicted ATPase